MPELGVNIDHIATIREARKTPYPDPVEAALMCERAGADSIVCHLREDRRHIQDRDLFRLKDLVKVKLNLEMALSEEIISIALKIKPNQITLVPEKREELTTEGGLDVVSQAKRIASTIKLMKKSGIEVSLFVDPKKDQIKASKDVGVSLIEIHTGEYANANEKDIEKEYNIIKESSAYGESLGLQVFAGHGLNYKNIKHLLEIPEIKEYNIGHSIVARSFFVGIEKAVKEMKDIIK